MSSLSRWIPAEADDYQRELMSLTTRVAELQFRVRLFGLAWSDLMLHLGELDDFEKALKRRREAGLPSEEAGDRVWLAVHAVVDTGMMVERLLGTRSNLRNISLRDDLRLGPGSVGTRTLRNTLAHYDERLVSYLAEDHDSTLVSAVLPEANVESLRGLGVFHALRRLDPTTFELRYRDELLPLSHLAADVALVQAALDRYKVEGDAARDAGRARVLDHREPG